MICFHPESTQQVHARHEFDVHIYQSGSMALCGSDAATATQDCSDSFELDSWNSPSLYLHWLFDFTTSPTCFANNTGPGNIYSLSVEDNLGGVFELQISQVLRNGSSTLVAVTDKSQTQVQIPVVAFRVTNVPEGEKMAQV